jgi:hypothetical protein
MFIDQIARKKNYLFTYLDAPKWNRVFPDKLAYKTEASNFRMRNLPLPHRSLGLNTILYVYPEVDFAGSLQPG